MCKELDKAGIPCVHINAFDSVAKSAGSNRIVFGGNFTSPVGNPDLLYDVEKEYRRRIVSKALEALTTDVLEPIVFTVDEEKEL